MRIDEQYVKQQVLVRHVIQIRVGNQFEEALPARCIELWDIYKDQCLLILSSGEADVDQSA